MKQSRSVEIIVGLFVIAGVAALFVLAMRVSNLATYTGDETYEVTARFDNIGSLRVRSPVSMAGVTVGRVRGIGIDEETYEAVVSLAIEQRYDRIPQDTSASILTAGLLGEQYVGLEPGGAERYLQGGDEIRLTQSALVLERMIGRFLFKKAQEEK
ncbi:MAG: outer membrane lipid asymmetry maintenance protein MlaD [Gammaproteobacteria bacterium]|nr:outer membrane lipid asymmetry maintenance protein MlaD [Gammaproteobacteria bacterium]